MFRSSKIILLTAITLTLSACFHKQDPKITAPKKMPIYNHKYLKLSQQNLAKKSKELVTYEEIVNYSEDEEFINEIIEKNNKKLMKSGMIKNREPIIDPVKDFAEEKLPQEKKEVKGTFVEQIQRKIKENLAEKNRNKEMQTEADLAKDLPNELPNELTNELLDSKSDDSAIKNMMKDNMAQDAVTKDAMEKKIPEIKEVPEFKEKPTNGVTLKEMMRNRDSRKPLKLLPMKRNLIIEENSRYQIRREHTPEYNRGSYRDY